jgi:hypothetical protein
MNEHAMLFDLARMRGDQLARHSQRPDVHARRELMTTRHGRVRRQVRNAWAR